jgi:hypothetical protein
VHGRSATRRLRFSDAAPLRLRLRDAEGVPVLDAHTEGGSALEVALPEAWATGAVVERAGTNGAAATLDAYAVPDQPEVLGLAALQPIAARGSARGPAEVFQKLFARPFGPLALAAYVDEKRSAPPPVFGVSREDTARMRLLLGQIETREHGQRLLGSLVVGSTGALLGVAGGTLLAYDHQLTGITPRAAQTVGGVYLGMGALALANAGYALVAPWTGERVALDYREAIARGEDPARAFAAADQRLTLLSAREHRLRMTRATIGALFILGSAAAIVANEVNHSSADTRFATRVIGGTGIVFGASVMGASLMLRSPLEELTTIWREDPGLMQLQAGRM